MSETRKDTKPLCGFQDRCSPSEPYCGQTPCAYHEAVVREAEQTLRDHAPHLLAAATPPTPESDAHREVRESVVCEKCYGLTSCWCQPTPDRAAVREALVRVFDAAISESLDSARNVADLCEAFGLNYLDADSDHQLADALLAAVSRPAEARRTETYPHDCGCETCPDHTHPAPSDGGADDWTPSGVEYDRAIHHNPDAKAWADLFVQTFPRLADKHDLMLGWFANAMMAMHDSMKSRDDAAPRPETGEPSDAMVEAYRAATGEYARTTPPPDWDGIAAVRIGLRAALAAREGA